MIQKGSKVLLNYSNKISWHTIIGYLDENAIANLDGLKRGVLPLKYKLLSEDENIIRYFNEDQLECFKVNSPLLLALYR